MKFRTNLLLGIVALVAGTLVATASGITAVLQQAARRDVAAELDRTRELFRQLSEYRRSLYHFESRVIAEEPRLKAVAATEDVSRETVLSVVEDLQREIASDLFIVVDAEGRLIVDASDKGASGQSLRDQPSIAGALARGEQSGIWTAGGRAFHVEALRLAFGDRPFGVLVLGYRIDDSVATVVAELTGSSVIVGVDDQPIASSPIRGARPDEETMRAILRRVPGGDARDPLELVVGGARHLALGATLGTTGSGASVRYVVLRSLDDALAPARAAARVVYLTTAGALVAAVLFTLILSRRLSRPLDRLAGVISAVGRGELSSRAEIAGPVEVQALGAAMNRMAEELEESRKHLAAKERMQQELEIGARIQTSILPQTFTIPGLDVAATMLAATEVGGDYYDAFPVGSYGWIGIGDVAGHGLTAGLVMLMVQSTIALAARERPGASPGELLALVNDVLVENIRNRLRKDEYVTLTLFRYEPEGRLVFAGAHEEIVLFRRATRKAETIPTPGTWLGARRSVQGDFPDSELRLEDGDIMVLYTDGITEAMDATGSQFGLERLVEVIEQHADEPVASIRDAVVAAVSTWMAEQADDITLLVLRHSAPGS